MPKREAVQRSFGGGEISPKLLMRGDTQQYNTAALEMTNFMPTPQGTAQRMPGTRYLYEVDALTARIIPYLTSSNERTLLLITPNQVRILAGVMDNLETGQTGVALPTNGGTVTFRKRILENGEFRNGTDPWVLTPPEYFGGKNGNDGPLGAFQYDNADDVWLSARLFKYNDETFVTAENTAEVDVASDKGTIEYQVDYTSNPQSPEGGYVFRVEVSDQSDYSNLLFEDEYTELTHPMGSTFIVRENFDLPTAAWTGTLYIRLSVLARASTKPGVSDPYSHPFIIARVCHLYANGQTIVTRTNVVAPYLEDELKDLHYVQSPYERKELAITHPRHAPHELFFVGNYQFQPISFTNEPTEWGVNTYPASCTSYHGRLILAGGQTFKTLSGDPLASVSETVWGTEVGKWDTFSASNEVDPDDSIQFTAIYRSPIQWVIGDSSLLIGALEYEYSASADGIFSPGDLGVKKQSTHGSINVQPAAFGEGVLFPSDAGTKVRMLSYFNEKQSWVAQDITLLNPSICYPRIVRMARCRHPHQMCLALLSSGDVAIFNSESGIEGWCRYRINNGTVQDLCVAPDNDGVDVPFFLVRRVINGVEKLYVECIPNFLEAEDWSYLQSSVSLSFDNPTSVITGLEHLENQIVQVRSSLNYIGFFKVQSGQITLQDGNGTAIEVIDCEIGLQHRSTLRTMPAATRMPGSIKRFANFAVRVLSSIRPIVNGERVADRHPETSLGASQGLDDYYDCEVSDFDPDELKSIEISEHLPFPVEILGVYGTLVEEEV